MPTYDKLTTLEMNVWAEGGEIENPSGAKIDTGWEAEEKPPHEYFNWWMNKTDRGVLYLLQQGVPSFDPSFSYLASKKSIVKGSTGSLFLAIIDSTGQDPELDIVGTYWKKLIDSSGAVAVSDITPYMWTLLEAVDASTAQTILGGGTVGKALFSSISESDARTAIGGSFFTDRANHSGVQPISSVSGLQAALDAKEILANKSTTLAGANDTTFPTTKAVADAISIAASGESYRGEWNASTNTPTLVSSTGTAGYYYRVSVAGNTTLDGVSGWQLGDEVYFNGSVWVKRPNYFPSLTTDDVSEATNLYFTAGRVRAVTLNGLSTASAVAITSTDTIIDALGKIQAQLNTLSSRLPPSGGSSGQILAKASGSDYDYTWINPITSTVVPVNDLGARAGGTSSETVALDCTAYTDWSVSLNGAGTTGTLTLNLTNIPAATATGKYVGYIRIVRGGQKTVSITVPAGKTFNWIQGSAPPFTNVSGEYDVVMFYNQLGEAKIHGMVVDTGVL